MDTEKLGPDCLDSQMRRHSTPETQSVYYVQLDRGVELLHTAASRRQGSWCAAESRNHPNLGRSNLSVEGSSLQEVNIWLQEKAMEFISYTLC